MFYSKLFFFSTKIRVAIKLMLQSGESGAAQNEREIMSKTNHQFIVKILDSIFTQLNFGIVMEFYDVKNAYIYTHLNAFKFFKFYILIVI